jgi:hypothetical protein
MQTLVTPGDALVGPIGDDMLLHRVEFPLGVTHCGNGLYVNWPSWPRTQAMWAATSSIRLARQAWVMVPA